MSAEFLTALAAIEDIALFDTPADMQPFLTDWRKRHHGRALAVVSPGSTDAVAAVVALCNTHRVPIFPQGGNTSLCGSSVPDESGNGIVVSLRRMNRILAVDAQDNSMIVEAGCILAHIQDKALEVDRLFPMSLGAEGSCQIGGNVSTNAGGTAVLRYGNTRDLVLGIEAVLPNGTIWSGLRTLRKNNTGYDLKNLLVGAEGTLGIVTKVALKLFPMPRHRVTGFVAVSTIEAASRLASDVQNAFPGTVSAVELFSGSELDIVMAHLPNAVRPLSSVAPWYVLVELAGMEDEEALSARFTELLEAGMASSDIIDAVIAANERQRQQLWHIRHGVAEANMKAGRGVAHDAAVSPARIPELVNRSEKFLAERYPEATPVVVGHLGDGNLHYYAMFQRADWALMPEAATIAAINRAIYDIAVELGGTFSAEHGIGSIHLDDMRRYKTEGELSAMAMLKAALDPLGIMNPGRVLPT